MTSAEDYKAIADEAYAADPIKQEHPAVKGDRFSAGAGKPQFEVYDTATDPETGFQAMAVVPILGGEPDFSKVVVSYAGTNPDDRADIVADLQSVIGEKSGVGTQVPAALAFATRVQDQLKAEGHSGASIETVGHSLGGYLALLVAAENHWPSTSFNGPDPWDRLSPQAKRWIEHQLAKGKNPLTNYVNEYDVVGNLLGNHTGAANFVTSTPGQGLLDYHNLSAFEINPDGSIKGAGGGGQGIDAILQNAAESLVPGSGRQLGPILGLVVVGVRTPGVAVALAGLVVAVDTIGAIALAASIASTEPELKAIKSLNDGLISEMSSVLDVAKRAVYLHPFISEEDIENCVSLHRLHVHHNIDESAVAAVNSLVDDHVVTVWKIYDGVIKTVKNAAAQDAQWALAIGGR